jgi:phospholipase C
MREPVVTRRKFVAAGLGAAGVAAAGGSEAWSRPLEWLALGRHALRAPGSLPRPFDPVGTPGAPREIDTVVVLMLENHSFDDILGLLPYRSRSRREVDGLFGNGRTPPASNLDSAGNPVRSFHLPDDCPSEGLTQNWNSSHNQYDGGRNDGFVTNANSTTPMGYFDDTDFPITYALATQFPINERYFCSLLGQTDPNRLFLFCGTSNGQTNDTLAPLIAPIPNGSIFDRLDARTVSRRRRESAHAQLRG